MNRPTTRAASIMAFNIDGTHVADFTARNRGDWYRFMREARERAGIHGTVYVFGATVHALTGKLISVAAGPILARGSHA